MSHRRIRPKLAAFLLLATTLAGAQNQPAKDQDNDQPAPPHRPRIALALSGGGARGLAHIGVLQWMEENHIPVDAIAGTSMGGIVGAMYASGSTPKEMRQIVHEINWDEVTATEPPYSELSFRRKEDRRNDQIAAHLGLKHGLSGPIGLSPGQGVGLLLDRISIKYPNLTDFDDLPTPFRCVATDMLTGDPVILKGGSLTQSLRATMAIPGIFTPVDLGGKVLADGGLVDNIPTDVARMMNAAIVIAVNTGTPLVGRKQLETLSGFLTQAVSVMTLGNDSRALAQADLAVSPQLGDYTILDFSHADEIMRLGYQGADANRDALRKYKVSDAEWEQYVAERDARKKSLNFTPQALQVAGVSPAEEKHLQKRLRAMLGQPLNPDQLDLKLTRITGQGQFDTLGYEGFTQNGVPTLRVIAHEKTYGPPFVDLNVNIGGAGASNLNFSAGARITFMDVMHHGGEWRNDLLLGSSNLAATEFYQPLGSTRFFVAPYLFASKVARNAFTGTTRIALLGDARQGGGLDFGYNTGRRSELRLGYEIFNGRLAPLIGDPGLAAIAGSTGLVRARYIWDGQDSPTVPSRGTQVIATLSRVFQSPQMLSPIEQMEIRTSSFFPTSEKTSIFLAASGGTSFNSTAGPFQVFTLGGPFRLGAYLPDEFAGNHYAYAALGFRRQFYRLPQLVGKKIYWAGWYEAGSAFNDPASVAVHSVFNAGVIAETIVGPIALAGSLSQTGHSRVNFSIGRLF